MPPKSLYPLTTSIAYSFQHRTLIVSQKILSEADARKWYATNTVDLCHTYIHTHTHTHTIRLNMWKEASVATVEREEKLSAAASALEHNLTLGAELFIYVRAYVS